MIEVRVSVEIGDTGGDTNVRVYRAETVVPVNASDVESAGVQAAAALDRMLSEVGKAATEQAQHFVAVLRSAASDGSETEDAEPDGQV